MTEAARPRVFIGSSKEGKDVARYLQTELGDSCDVDRWDQSVFEPGGYTLESLINAAKRADFAVLVASSDDKTVSRGEEQPSVRDNIVLEFGLFAGVLGRERTYLLATDHKLKLPTDTLGLTRLSYNASASGRAAVTAAALELEERFRAMSLRDRSGVGVGAHSPSSVLDQELALLRENAESQGWVVKTDSPSTLRLRSPRGRSFAMTKGPVEATRDELRVFAARLHASGLRVSRTLRLPVSQSPF